MKRRYDAADSRLRAAWPHRTARSGIRRLSVLACVGVIVLAACDAAYPEVVVVNRIAEHVLIKGVSFNGCYWDGVLAYGDATAPGRCLPGEDHVHFQKFDAVAYCKEQVHDQTIDGLCICGSEGEPPADPMDPGLINLKPLWFRYQTITIKDVSYRDFHRIELIADDLEQDFSAPGPYGH